MKPRKRSPCVTVPMLVSNLTAVATLAWAGCKSDCREEYDSAIESCKLLYDDPDDADDLQLCIHSARDDYESCIDECNN